MAGGLVEYLRGRMLLAPTRAWSFRDTLDLTYTLLIDGHVGMIDILKVKVGLDESLASMIPDREAWGMDADVMEVIPPAAGFGGVVDPSA